MLIIVTIIHEKGSNMSMPKVFEDLAKKLYDVLPENLKQAEADVEQQFKEILMATFAKLNLITREEFDVQCKVLLRTREKIEQLQKNVDQLLMEKTSNTQH